MALSNAVLRLAALGTAGFLSITGSVIAQTSTPRPTHIPSPTAATTLSAQAPTHGTSSNRVLQSSSVPTIRYDHGDPTNDEQLMLEMINRARANPTAEGEMLASTTDPGVSSAYTYFNIDRNKLRTDFATYPVRPPLAFNKSLIQAARLHSHDMDQNNFQGHVGSNGSQFTERMSDAGYGMGSHSGENVAAYSNNVFYGHAGLNVDWGAQNQIDLGHRTNIMNFREYEYTEIGIGIVQNGKGLPNTGPYIITQDFGRANAPFIVGVVYNDMNGNSFYDPGEGLGGVTIMPSSGQYYAVTSSSGGYAIPCPTSGSWSITASGGVLPAGVTQSVTFKGGNVKVDFRPNIPSVPAAVTLNLPANFSTINTDSVRFVWQRATGTGVTYHVQVSTNTNFADNILVNDSTLTDTSLVFKGLNNQEQYYYWRVRAKNDIGWGVYSEKRLLEAAIPPSAITLTSPANGAEVLPGTVEFSWEAPPASQGSIRRYWFELGTDPEMNDVEVLDSIVIDPMKSIPNLDRSRTYYWRVKALNLVDWGAYSPTWSIQTAASGVARERANALFSLSASTPNPFSGSTTIAFELARPEYVTLTVLDNRGHQVAVLAAEQRGAGRHEVRWNAEGAANGVYYYQLRAGEFTETQTVVLTR